MIKLHAIPTAAHHIKISYLRQSNRPFYCVLFFLFWSHMSSCFKMSVQMRIMTHMRSFQEKYWVRTSGILHGQYHLNEVAGNLFSLTTLSNHLILYERGNLKQAMQIKNLVGQVNICFQIFMQSINQNQRNTY